MLNSGALNEDVANGDGLLDESAGIAGRISGAVRTGWQGGRCAEARNATAWRGSGFARGAGRTAWDTAARAGAIRQVECAAMPGLGHARAARWERSLRLGEARIDIYAGMSGLAGRSATGWAPALPVLPLVRLADWAGLLFRIARGRSDTAPALPLRVMVVEDWTAAGGLIGARSTAWTIGLRPIWRRRRPSPGGGGGGEDDHDGGSGPNGGRFLIPILRAYIMLHEVTVKRVSDGIALPCSDFTLSLTADGRDIDFSGTLLGAAAADAVMPADDGTPVEIEVSVDGVARRILVETVRENLGASARSVSVSGRSLSSRLGAPYYQPSDRTSAAPATAQQLAIAELPEVGWALAWSAVDWVVPAGAWSARGLTPIQAIQAIAASAGAIVVPGRTGQSLTVQPRYPVLPWDFGTATPNLVLARGTYTQRELQSTVPAQGNAVFLQGGAIGGLLARAYRSGTAGDRLLPPVQDDLLTHLDAARARGERILAGQQRQPLIRSFEMPIGPLFPQVQIGQLIRLETRRGPVLGIANSEKITFRLTKTEVHLRQEITLGEDTPNVWAAFTRLLPADPLLVGTIAAIGDGVASVAVTGGGTLRVRGEGSVGQKVYVRGGRIEDAAPDLPDYDLEI